LAEVAEKAAVDQGALLALSPVDLQLGYWCSWCS
jgi:hypothetical protein